MLQKAAKKARTKPQVKGLFYHRPSSQYFAYIGYHERTEIDPITDNKIESRVRTTCYFGTDPTEAVAKFYQVKGEWHRVIAAEREQYEEQKAWKSANELPPPARFKPIWPKEARDHRMVRLRADRVKQVADFFEDEKKQDALNLTIREAREKYLADCRARIGLQAGKGINQNSYDKHAQNLTLALGLNTNYSRSRKPIDVDRTLEELKHDDYRDFVRFWCDPAVVKSERTGANYIHAFKRMLDALKVKLPEDVAELFSLKIRTGTKIVRYQPVMLKKLLGCEDDRARLFQLMFLNFGYYAVDVARLRFDHITDAEGNPYAGRGEMFITRHREKTRHQNDFATTCYVWPETQALMQRLKAPSNPSGTYFLSQFGEPYSVKTISGVVEQVIRNVGLARQFSVKQYQKVGASQIKALAGTDAMHQYKANAPSAADKPYILEDFSILTAALKKLRKKLKADGVL